VVISCIVAGTDGSPTAHIALRHAVSLASDLGARLHLVAAAPRMPAWVVAEPSAAVAASEACAGAEQDLRDSLDRTARDLRADGLRVTTHIATGEPANVIVSEAEQVGADLIVIGNRGVRRLTGGVPRRVSRQASCSVLIVRTT